jgi:riboflavin synthase
VFTGLIEEIGEILKVTKRPDGVRIEIGARSVTQDLLIGDSIAINGCCLTVVERSEHSFSCDIVKTTWDITCLYDFRDKDPVNLERAISPLKRFGGHFVQGHVDSVGTIGQRVQQSDGSTLITIHAPKTLLRYIINKGSIAVDGVSLTVAACSADSFTFALIPHSAKCTILGRKEVGKCVNLEVDLIAKYVEKLHGRVD